MCRSSSARRRRVGAVLVLGTSLAASAAVRAQDAGYHDRLTAGDIGGVIVTVSVPETNADVDAASRTMLRSRIGAVLAAGGLAGVGVETPFVMYPLVAVADVVTSDGGLQTRTVAKVELSFVLRHVVTRSVIHQWTGTVIGTGTDRASAVRNALGRVSPSDDRLVAFASDSRDRIVGYYERTCDGLRAQARAAARTGRADEAYAMLLAVPTDAHACQAAAAHDVEGLAAAADEAQCERELRALRATAAAGDDRSAARRAALLPATPRCGARADSLLDTIDRRAHARRDEAVRSVVVAARRTRAEVAASTGSASAEQRAKERAAAIFNGSDARTLRIDLLR